MVNNFIDPGLEDLCVSCTSFTLGHSVDFDPGHVVCVGGCAFNYLTALASVMTDMRTTTNTGLRTAFVGKEIVRFHSIVWPAMLMSMGPPLPKKVFGHVAAADGGKMF